MRVDIIVPTCKGDVSALVAEIERTRCTEGDVIFTGLATSASNNRNAGMNASDADILIMVDDDITGLADGWDMLLVDCLRKTGALMVSARLLNRDGSIQDTCANNYDLGPEYIIVETRPDALLPTACVCFWNTDLRFDPVFIGSGWEDTDFCRQLLRRHGHDLFVICNTCRVTHLNEAKNQSGDNWLYNRQYFCAKWGLPYE